MPEQPTRPSSRRPRPVAELALEPLIERAGELARRWAVALILESPPESLGEVPLEDLAREAPVLLGAVVGALRSDGEMDALLAGGRSGQPPAARISEISGRRGVGGVVAAVEALRGVLADALMDEFAVAAPDPARARQLTDLADRLAHVCAAVTPVALAGRQAAAEGPQASAAEVPFPVRPVRPAGAAPRRAVRSEAVLIDERAPAETPRGGGREQEAAAVGGLPAIGEIQIRDERGDEGPGAWIRSIGGQLERFEEDRIPFAVLLVELRAEAGQSAELAWEPIEELLAAELGAGAGARVTRERAGRYWLLVPATDRLGAAGLAARLTLSLESHLLGRRVGLSVAVGTAVCPEDGRKAAALAAHADVGLYAARAERHHALPAEGRAGS